MKPNASPTHGLDSQNESHTWTPRTWYSLLLLWLFIPFWALLHLGNTSLVSLVESCFTLVTSNIRSSPLDTFYRLVSFQNGIKHTVVIVRFWSALILTFAMFRFYFFCNSHIECGGLLEIQFLEIFCSLGFKNDSRKFFAKNNYLH